MDEAARINEEIRRRSAEIEALKEQAAKRGIDGIRPDAMTDRNGTSATMPWERMRFQTAIEFIDAHPILADPLIDGLFRRGETVNVIGSTKEGKSWLILGMALSVATGRPWMGRDTMQGKVALIDNELQPATLSSRLRTVAHAMMVPENVLAEDVLVLSLRGNLCGMAELMAPIKAIKHQDVVMV